MPQSNITFWIINNKKYTKLWDEWMKSKDKMMMMQAGVHFLYLHACLLIRPDGPLLSNNIVKRVSSCCASYVETLQNQNNKYFTCCSISCILMYLCNISEDLLCTRMHVSTSFLLNIQVLMFKEKINEQMWRERRKFRECLLTSLAGLNSVFGEMRWC